MDEWKYQTRRRKRGSHCALWGVNALDGTLYTRLCGCGHRTPPAKRERSRMVRRELKRQLRECGRS